MKRFRRRSHYSPKGASLGRVLVVGRFDWPVEQARQSREYCATESATHRAVFALRAQLLFSRSVKLACYPVFFMEGSTVMLDFGQARSALLQQLTESERDRAVVYELSETVAQGTVLSFPHLTINVPSDALVAFIDQEPTANWGHACRYVLVELNTGRISSWTARFPPFSVPLGSAWRVAYQAKSVPEGAVVWPKPSTQH